MDRFAREMGVSRPCTVLSSKSRATVRVSRSIRIVPELLPENELSFEQFVSGGREMVNQARHLWSCAAYRFSPALSPMPAILPSSRRLPPQLRPNERRANIGSSPSGQMDDKVT